MTIQMKRLLNRAATLQEQIKELTEEYETVKAELKHKMKELDFKSYSSSKAKANYSEFLYESFSRTDFKKHCPKIYGRYVHYMPQERLTITTLK